MKNKINKNKNKKERGMILTLTSVLKSRLSHLMGEASCPSFIDGAWSRVQLMRQKIWTHSK